MKPQLTLVALFLFFGSLTAQVKFKVKLLTDNTTYQVLFKPETSWSNPLSTTGSSVVSLRMPSGGFTLGTITSLKGTWVSVATVVSPAEAPGFTYQIFQLQNAIPGNQITYTQGVEIPMFNFKNNGSCMGPIEIVDNATDPFLTPNSQNVFIGNTLSVLANPGGNAYIGNYTAFDADCTPNTECELEIYDVSLTSPSACGVADGCINIVATNPNGLPLQYSIDDGVGWQNSPSFCSLAAGDTYIILVRDILGCTESAGSFQLAGPLAAIVQSVDLTDPACGGTNGSITINAISANGGTIQFAMSLNGPWQNSHTFNNLAQGSYSFWVRDITNNCQDFIGTYSLDGCAGPNCIITYDLNYLGNGRYEVNMLTDTTFNFPFDAASNLQVTVKVPTGGFVASNLTEQIPNVDFVISEVVNAPVEDPLHDYITFSLNNPPQNIPIIDGNTVHLFYFENSGACTGDSIRLMELDDPFQGSSAGQYIKLLGFGATDVDVCLGEKAAICDVLPPAPPSCTFTYELEELAGDIIQVSMISDTTFTATWNFTNQAQVTVKVPTGGFQVGSLTDIKGNWEVLTPYDVAPIEDPTSDYILIYLADPTNLDVFQAGVKIPMFSFKNNGTCQGGPVVLMAEDDPFFPPNSTNSNVGQYIAPQGAQGQVIPICLSNLPADDCTNDPCAGLVPLFVAPDGCEGTSIAFKDSTITTDPITSWSWDFGDASALGTGPTPSHTYSSSGNFEVSLTVTTQTGCNATFMDFVTVFPSPGDAPVSSYTICNGLGVTLETPANITTAVWSPTTGLDTTDPFNPIANPSATTTYTLTATNANGCVNISQVTVNVINKPILNNVAVTPITDCNKSDASITVTATGTGTVEYGLDNGNGIVWQASSVFANLAAGTYDVYVRNIDGSCPVAYNNNPITLTAPIGATIVSVVQDQPNGCNDDGSITINATGGLAPLQYSITGAPPFTASNVFDNLGGGTYNIVVRNSDGTCATLAGPIVFTEPAPPTISSVADQNICVGTSTNISLQLSNPIASYQINGTGVHSTEVVNGSTFSFVATANALGSTNYSVILSEANGCSATESFNLTGIAVPTASFTVSPVICTDGNVVLNFTGTSLPTASLNWNLAGGIIINASAAAPPFPANATMIVKWTTPGTKTITLSVDNGGCLATSNQTINVSSFNPGATFTVTNATCGLSNGAINLSTNGAYNYNWSNQASTEDLANIQGGTYFVTITDTPSGCQTTATSAVNTTPAVDIASITATPATLCTGGNGDGSIAIAVSGGTGPFTYTISNNTPVSNAPNTIIFSDQDAGIYQVTVTDALGCTDNGTGTVTSTSSQITATVNVVDAGCTSDNGSLTANAGGGQVPYTYSLYKNNQVLVSGQPVVNSSISLNNLEPAEYTIIFEDASGCIGAGTGVVERTEGVFTAAATIIQTGCGSNNGSILLTGLPNTLDSIAWYAISGTYLGSSNPLSNIAAGVYTAKLFEVNGCTSDSTFIVSSTGGQVVSIDDIIPASCGQGNGSLIFTITGGNGYIFNVLGTNLPSGFGTSGIQDTIPGLGQGAYVLEIIDVNQQSCKVYKPFVVTGGSAMVVSRAVTYATGCGNEDGSICVEIFGGVGAFAATASDGVIVPGSAPNEFCVTDLYEGIVTIDISDAVGCSVTIIENMGDFNEPSISLTDIDVIEPICPGDTGSIVSTSSVEYEIFDYSSNFRGLTPWGGATPGLYKARLVIDGCTAWLDSIEVLGPNAWSVISTIHADECQNNPGSVSLAISGATAPYTVLWNTAGNDTTTSITGLAHGTYTATVTDANGCSTISANIVADSCSLPNCPGVFDYFYLDTIYVDLTASLTEVCLPTDSVNLSEYDLNLNDEPYLRVIGNCDNQGGSNFYNGFDMLPAGPPYFLEAWKYGNESAPIFQFDLLQELVDYLNDLDPTGNWALVDNSIFGGAPGVQYGNMKIRHQNTGTTIDLQVNTVTVPRHSILVDNSRQTQMFVVIDPINGCQDTVFLNVQLPQQVTDTIQVDVPEGGSLDTCISIIDLVGNIESITNICPITNGNAQVNINETDPCVELVGTEEGTAEACIVICTDLGVCDTTIVQINVYEFSTEIEIYTGFSPNDDGVNDVFKINNIQLYPDNELEIYNRWGKKVFSQKGYNNAWAARYRNTYLTDGTYFYILHVNVKGDKREYKGFVEVRR